jgi:hypothetical protein
MMITELANILPDFSKVNHTWCFLHIVNLCAKSIIKQFDVQKKQDNEPLSEAECELQGLAGDIEFEEQQAIEAMAQHAIDSETNIELREMMILRDGSMRWHFYYLMNRKV